MPRALVSKDSRLALIAAADRAFQRYGYRKTTVEDIATEAGVSRATVYLHFRGKVELALAWVEQLSLERRAAMAAIAAGPEDPHTKLRCMIVARVMLSFDRVQGYTRSLDELLAELRPILMAHRVEGHEKEAQLFASVIEEGQNAEMFRSADARELGRHIVTATGALMPYSLTAAQLGHRHEVEQSVEGVADLLIAGLARQPSVGGEG